jgi:hypothetical protein
MVEDTANGEWKLFYVKRNLLVSTHSDSSQVKDIHYAGMGTQTRTEL